MKFSATQFSVISAGVLLLITATANAKIMFIVGSIGLFIGLLFLRNNQEDSSVLTVTLGFFFVLVIALVIRLQN